MNYFNERYGLQWPGKSESTKCADSPASAAIEPEFDCIDPDRCNVFIEGDNLDALKIIENKYKEKIRFIYIDPPYNTGKHFSYNDNFKKRSKKSDTGNSGENRHSDWLSMIYPRLLIASRLLLNDGIIYVSINDSELHNLLLVMDEIFGEENRVGIITWVKKKKGSHLSKTLRNITEYVVAYGKNASSLDLYGEDAYPQKWQPLVKRINREQVLKFPADSVEVKLKKKFYKSGIYGRNGISIEFLDDIYIKDGRIRNPFSIKARFVWNQKKLDEEISLGSVISIRSEGMTPNVSRHNQSTKKKRPPTLLNSENGVGTNEDAWKELSEIFGAKNIYSYPKPISLLLYLINTISRNDPSGIFLDFFAGSGTTGHAVSEANKKDGGTRKFLLIQSPEPISPPVTLKDGSKISTISDLCRERLKRTCEETDFFRMTY